MVTSRLNFTLEALDVSCPAYGHFTETLERDSALTARQLPVDFPQFLEYDRVKELVSCSLVPLYSFMFTVLHECEA